MSIEAAIGVEWCTPPAAAVSIAIEDIETFLRDGGPLFHAHAKEVGKVMRYNAPLARQLAAIGAGQIMVARSNGEMVGYLVFLVAPSLVGEGETGAMQNTFYVAPEFRGHVGGALLRASVRALWDRGANEIMLRAGVVGSGFRLDAMYQRLGAVPYGRLYLLKRPSA